MTALANDRLTQSPAHHDPSEVDPEMESLLDRSLTATAASMANGHSYATAVVVQKQRHLPDVKRRLLEEAQLAGSEFYYGWGVGKNAIEGPSVKLAMALARCWGNCVVETLPVQDMPDSWIFSAAFVDLETGYTLTRQFRQSKKWQVFGKHDEERKDDVRFQIGQSKAARNVVLNALPSYLVDAAMQKAKEGVRDRIQQYIDRHGMAKAVDYVVIALVKAGVAEEAILSKCGRAARSGLSLDDLVILKSDLAAIQNGQERPETLFPAPAADPVWSGPKTESISPFRLQEADAQRQAAKVGQPNTPPVANGHTEPAAAPTQAAITPPVQPPPVAGKKVSHKLKLAVLAHFARLKLTPVDVDGLLAPHKAQAVNDLSVEQAEALIRDLAECQPIVGAAPEDRGDAYEGPEGN